MAGFLRFRTSKTERFQVSATPRNRAGKPHPAGMCPEYAPDPSPDRTNPVRPNITAIESTPHFAHAVR